MMPCILQVRHQVFWWHVLKSALSAAGQDSLLYCLNADRGLRV